MKKEQILKPCVNKEHGLFIAHARAMRYSFKTLSLHTYCLNYFYQYIESRGIVGWTRVTRQHLLDYLGYMQKKGLSKASMAVFLRPVRLFFRYLEEQQKIFINPAKDLSFKAEVRLPTVLSEEEVRRMLDAPDTGRARGVRDKAFMELAYSTGMRRAELIQLDLADINTEDASVRFVGKGGKERVLPIGKSAMRWLNEYVSKARVELLEGSENKALWVKQGGGRLNYDCVQCLLTLHKKKACITRKVSCHDFRRAFATHMLQHGAGPVDVQHLLGHADLHHLRSYLCLTIADLKKIHSASVVGK